MASDIQMRHKRILLTRLKFVGDIVLTTPIIRSVRSALPDAYIAYLGSKDAVSLLEGNPFLDEIIPFDFRLPTVIEQTRVMFLVRRRKFDLVVDLFGNPRSALISRASGANVRVGPARPGRGRLYTIQVRDDGRPKTAIAFHNQYITAAGIQPTAASTEIFLDEREKREARIFLQWFGAEGVKSAREGKPIIGMHPGGSWPAKRWFPERFADLADLIAARLGAQVVLTVGPDDIETASIVARKATSSLHVLDVLPLRQLAAVIAQCRVFISNDAGPMHIAAALGIPTIGLFGPGEENVWFPYSGHGHKALRHDVPCHPCHLDFCNREGSGYMECMQLLSAKEVFAEVATAFTR
jgi:ADP-heptose:LPS heptosyltransferase